VSHIVAAGLQPSERVTEKKNPSPSQIQRDTFTKMRRKAPGDPGRNGHKIKKGVEEQGAVKFIGWKKKSKDRVGRQFYEEKYGDLQSQKEGGGGEDKKSLGVAARP